jgi:hypothetical protein
MGSIMLVVFAVLAGFAVGGWQWASRGITVQVVSVPAIPGQWREVGAPTVRGIHTHQFVCADGYPGMGKPNGPTLVGGNLQYADSDSNPDFVRCYALIGHHEAIMESQFRGLALEDIRQATGAGAVAYLFLLAFTLSNRALRRSRAEYAFRAPTAEIDNDEPQPPAEI